MSYLVACSGAVHSGKTTFIQRAITEADIQAALHENIRATSIKSIDAVRKDAKAYLNLQIDRITAKVAEENRAMTSASRGVVLADRSLVDSLFYLTFHVSKANLDHLQAKRFHVFFQKIVNHLSGRYKAIFLFRPISTQGKSGKFRPKDICFSQQTEWEMIRAMTYGFLGHATPPVSIFELDATREADVIKAITILKTMQVT